MVAMSYVGRLQPGALKSPANLDAKSAAEFLSKNGIRFIQAQFVDTHGGLKNKSVPVECLNSLLKDGAGFAGAAVAGFGNTPFDPDYMMVGDLSTLAILPWSPGHARIMGTGYIAGQPHPSDTRNVLQKQVARLKERGWTLNTGLEPEFLLLRRQADGSYSPFDETDTLAKPAYDYRGLTRNRVILEEAVGALQAIGFKVYQIDHEDANGQYEINFDFADALTSADNMQLVKMAVSQIAHDHGAICSFMPKLSETTTGNGMHVHCSIADAKGNNLFHDASDKNALGLSQLAYHFVGGLLHHAKALTALLSPSVNSYKRLVLGSPGNPSWAPVYITYGDNNRSAMLRIPYGRVEVRTSDGAMNPYLGTAAIIAAGLDGIDRKLDPGPPRNVNFYELSPKQVADLGVEVLPLSLDKALDALEADNLFEEALGAGLIGEFIRIKRNEWRDYHQTVAPWEVDRYLTFY